MQNIVNAIVQSPVARIIVLLVVIVPISFYLGTSPVRRGLLYYLGAFAPSVVMATAAGLWTWTWQWFWSVLVMGLALTIVTHTLVYLTW
jgi:hypothetical protein